MSWLSVSQFVNTILREAVSSASDLIKLEACKLSTVSAFVASAGTIFAVPSKEVPPIVLAVSSAVAVAALPVTSPVRSPVNDVATAVQVTVMPALVV